MRVHELHPMLIHAPLILLPAAVVTDLAAVVTRRWRWEWAGRVLWGSVVAGGLTAGVAGMAASQEVKAEDARARDMMFLHGLGNVSLVVGALGLAAWRQRRPPSVGSGLVGLAALAVAVYTGYLGGELVYAYGMGVKGSMGAEELERLSPPLGSREAPGRLLRDAKKGMRWVLGRAAQILSRRQRLEPGAYGIKTAQRRLEPVPEVGPGASWPESRPL
jgi:uncharacterized membrane protein